MKEAQYLEIMEEHDRLYEPYSLVYQIILPPSLDHLLKVCLSLRNRAIDRFPPLEAAMYGCFPDSGPLWFGMEGQKQTLWDAASLKQAMDRLTSYVHKFIPNLPPITSARFRQSFVGYYSTYGLRPEYMHYISSRAFYYAEIPLRYSRVNIAEVARAHAVAYEHIVALIQKEQQSLGFQPLTIGPPSPDVRIFPVLPSRYCGSWRTIREDVLQRIFQQINASLASPQGADSTFVPEDQAFYNCATRWCIFSLGLLDGLRPFELPRLLRQHVDLRGGWLAVHGKARGDEPAYRRLPLLPELLPILDYLIRKTPGNDKTQLFGLYKQADRWSLIKNSDISSMMKEFRMTLSLPAAPDFYSIRHRFRFEMLSAGLPFDLINYLMGHQAQGAQSVNPYREFCIEGLASVYLPAARAIARRFGVFNNISNHVQKHR